MKTKQNKKGRPPIVNWREVTPYMWSSCTDTEIAIYLGTSQPNVHAHRHSLIEKGTKYAQYHKGVNCFRHVRKEKFKTPYRTHDGGAYEIGIKLTPAMKLKPVAA